MSKAISELAFKRNSNVMPVESIKCAHCGGNASIVYYRCAYCNSPLLSALALDESQKKELALFASACEERLTIAKKKYDKILAITFVLAFFMSVALYFGLTLLSDSTLTRWLFTFAGGFSFFLFWGFLVGELENKALDHYYKVELKRDIDRFLEFKNIYRYDFDMTVTEMYRQTKKFLLKRFLYK